MSSTAPLLGPGLQVLERGWLSSNNVLLDDDIGGERGATLIDSGHCVHAAQTLALLRRELGARPLRRLLNTHLHSDHCGGNAALQRAWSVPTLIPADSWRAVQDWDDSALSYAATRQRCERFSAQGRLTPGEVLRIGAREWQVLGAPGHDPESLMLFDAEYRVLIAADALWGNGFGVVFPELDGEPGFDDVGRVLDLIESLEVRCVIPGHGPAFSDVAAALQRARQRLAGFKADPARHLRHGVKVLLKYHLMEEQQQPLAELRAWMRDVPLLRSVWLALGRPDGDLAAWADGVLQDLLAGGVLQLRGDVVFDV